MTTLDMIETSSKKAACWRHQDCRSCTHEKHGCGWCPTSEACVPASSLLEPVSNKDICPLSSERFELRTKALGCGCSTTTLLSVIVTVFATIAALILLFGLIEAIAGVNPFLGTGQAAGWEVKVEDNGVRKGRMWRRGGLRKWFASWRSPDLAHHSEQEERTERTRLLG
ncbi:uncharacterized protein RCC_07693 [Ramularia collo-cygni]|uniref:PSI domain-containing protein n=1 Tax=Ramularia collo-cygni TaxID=112498 RepID=A0A2D3VDF4_9PEZI|nr:uncharacterized protein RCC_07693 [Ramularia collo-cygni]CZT21826.1 uncharacterized protein RCC_07693 [Ramularia collo-cygni]